LRNFADFRKKYFYRNLQKRMQKPIHGQI